MGITLSYTEKVVLDEDIKKVVELAGEIWRLHYTPILGDKQVEYMLSKYQSFEAIKQQIDEGHIYELMILDDEVCGYFSYYPVSIKNIIFLSKLYILKKFRRKGLAETAMKQIIQTCVLDGFRAIQVSVNKRNFGSIAFYEKMGFRKYEDVIKDIGDGFTMDDYIFQKTIK